MDSRFDIIEVNTSVSNTEFPTRIRIVDFDGYFEHSGDYTAPKFTFSVKVEVEYNKIVNDKEENLVKVRFWTEEDSLVFSFEDDELDEESVDYLNINFPQLKDRIVFEDFLKLDLKKIVGDKQFVVIGNYPYNISSQIFFKVLDYKDQVVCCSGMLQREVAQRLAAGPGSKTYGILSVLLQAWYDAEYLFTVDEHVFNPPPKVKSGVIRFTRNQVQDLGCDERLLRTVVKTSFGQRRKQLRNSVKPLVPGGSPVLQLPVMNMRPEQLSVQEFIELTNTIQQAR